MADDRTLFTIDDLYQLGWFEDPRYSPDGRFIAFVRVSIDHGQNSYHRTIWVAPTQAGAGTPWRLTAGPKSDTSPRWSPDGRYLAFISNRGGAAPQIYCIAISGGEARQLTSLRHGTSDPAWSPDGTQIAFLSPLNEIERTLEDSGADETESQDAWEQQQAEDRFAYAEQQRFDPRILTRLPYRSGTSFFDDRRYHIYTVAVPQDDEATTEPPHRLTDGDLHYSAPAWMPDGTTILTTTTRDPEADSLFAYYDLLKVPVLAESRAEPQRLTQSGFSYYDPQPSPDGRWIALRRLPEARLLGAGTRLAIMPAEGGELHEITADSDLDIEQYCWQPDSAGLLYIAGWHGEEAIHHVAVAPAAAPSSRAIAVPAAGRIISSFDIGPDGSIAFVAGAGENPCEIYLWRPNGEETQVTALNRQLLAQRKVAPFEEIRYRAPDGREVQGWIIRPPDARPGQRYPLMVHIHGGPHTMWGPGARSMWHEWQTSAARGYVVFFCNPRGSDGYGQDWRDAIHASWGVADAPDILSGIDAVIARGGVDPQRIGVTGGSYGGYMTAWLIGHSSRFACAVSARGVYNLLTEHSTSDTHELIELEFDGYPWEQYERLWQHSPLAHAHKITTPLRILHSENDYRVPISEAEQLFAILRRRKQAVEFVRYPREGHELTRSGEPRHRADHLERTIEWFDRYCAPDTPPDGSATEHTA